MTPGGLFFVICSYFSTSVFWFAFRLRFSSILARFWGRFWDKHCEKKRGRKIVQKKVPPSRKQDPMTRPGGSWRPRLACAFFEQETMVRATAEALIGICRKSGLGSKWVNEKLIGLLKKVKASTETSVETNVETHVEHLRFLFLFLSRSVLCWCFCLC